MLLLNSSAPLASKTLAQAMLMILLSPERSEYVLNPVGNVLCALQKGRGKLQEDKELTGPQISVSFLAESNIRWAA
jgi:hypothetical protein